MASDEQLHEVLQRGSVRREVVVQAARYYVASRLDDPAPADVRADLDLVLDGDRATVAAVAADPRQLVEVSLAVLSAAWAEPAERVRVRQALAAATGRLPVADTALLAVMALYGLYLAGRCTRITETTTTDLDGRYVTRRVTDKGIVAVLAGQRRSDAGSFVAAGDVGAPAEATCSIALVDIQDSSKIVEANRMEAASWLRQRVSAAIRGIGVDPVRVPCVDRGDGVRAILTELLAGLTTVVNDLPDLLAGPLAARPEQSRLKVRLCLHTDRLRRVDGGWDGHGLTYVARMDEIRAVKDLLAASEHHLAVVVSNVVHSQIVWRGHARHDDYRKLPARLDDADTHVWMRLA